MLDAGQCQGRGGGAREEGLTKKESEEEERGEEGHPSPTHTGGQAGQRGVGTAHAAREGARACDPRPAGAPTPHPTHALPTSSQVKRERGERFLTGVLAFFHLPASAGGNLYGAGALDHSVGDAHAHHAALGVALRQPHRHPHPQHRQANSHAASSFPPDAAAAVVSCSPPRARHQTRATHTPRRARHHDLWRKGNG